MLDRFLITPLDTNDVMMKTRKKFTISRIYLHREFNQENKSSV